MNYVEFLEESAKSPSVPFMEFLRSQAPDTVHMFVEGVGDGTFYRHFVLRYFKKSDDIHVYYCGSKTGVYDAKKAISSRANQPVWADSMYILYFVDKDLSDILTLEYELASDIFVTDYYSIENYLVTDQMLHLVLTDMFTFRNNSQLSQEKIRQLKNKFNEQLNKFYELITPIMAWGIHLKMTEQSFKFRDISLSKLFAFENDFEIVRILPSSASTDIQALEAMCSINQVSYTRDDEEAILNTIRSMYPKLFVRGKFELWFFVKFVIQIKIVLQRESPVHIRYRDNLMKMDDLVVSLGPRMHPIPKSLASFFSDNISKRRARTKRKTKN